MARPFSAALFLAAFRSNFYAEFWDCALPAFAIQPHSPDRSGFCCLLMLLILPQGNSIIANTVHARPSRTGSPNGACVACPMQADYTHGCLRDNARIPPVGESALCVSHTGGCTPNVSLDVNFIKRAW